ncbi:UNVERIFIED_CONTAM: protein SAWADEE HOMEODOMAIN1 [Sesamum angustifolium]|uniref:Protein SAWADEE HOMEODOMAIN1 n=1 Tax=Sesamum angustifolium TaxID=2727405 RepID=A0AAW2LLQ6_9LAMI
MAITPEPLSGIQAVDFRAPPPSPVAPGRRSSFANDDVLTEYLQQSLKVPDLILPDRVFPRQKSVQNPPRIDLQSLDSLGKDAGAEISGLIAQVGCFEVINHGISRDFIKLVLDLAGGVFEIPSEKKKKVARSPERRYGFEEIHGEEEIKDQSEEFLWCGDDAMRLEMEGIWPIGYSNFSQEMERLTRKIEEVAAKILVFLQQHSLRKLGPENGLVDDDEQEAGGNVCCIQKQYCRKTESEEWENSLRYDVIRMLIRGSEFPHALCLHVCGGSSDFHVYSKKGWLSFCPAQHSLVATVGDKLQIVEMEKLFKKMTEQSISQEFCQDLSAKFNFSTHRSEKAPMTWEQVESWFQEKQRNLAATIIPSRAHRGTVTKKAAVIKKREKVPTISASEAAVQLPNLMFEARSAKDYAWFDVASFLSYRVLCSGEMVVRVRFAGFGKEEDEWVNIKRAVRERSIPLEHSECDRVNVGDLVLCFREAEDHALYCDAHVVEIERQAHDGSGCTCIFVVRYDHDNVEGKVPLDKLCCRPTSVPRGSEGGKLIRLLEPNVMQKLTM